MDDIPDYIDELGRKRWVGTLKCYYIGYKFNEFRRTSGATRSYWMRKYSLQFCQTIAVGECAIIDFVSGIDCREHCAINIIPFSHLRQKMSEWVPCIYPDLRWIIAEYVFDLQYVPKATRSSRDII